MYGSKLNAEGKEIQADNSMVMPVTGERVKDNKFISFGLAKDKEDNTVENRAEFIFKQKNGATVKIALFEGEEDWQIDGVNRTVKHIATKLIGSEMYAEKVEKTPFSSFQEFINTVADLLNPLASKSLYTMKFVYNKAGYVSVPSFPNFIATPDKEDSLTTNPKYDKYVLEAVKSEVPVEEDGDLF